MPRVVELFGVGRWVFAALINQHEPYPKDFGSWLRERPGNESRRLVQISHGAKMQTGGKEAL